MTDRRPPPYVKGRKGSVRRNEARETWEWTIDIGHPGERPRRQKRGKGYRTRDEAQSALDEFKASASAGTHVERSDQTVGQFFTEWIQHVRSTIEPTTWASYERNVRNHIIPAIGAIPLQHLRTADLSAFYRSLGEEGANLITDKPLSPRTVNYISTIVHRALREAVGWELIRRNPADGATRPKGRQTRKPLPRVWTSAELRRFLDGIAKERIFPIVYLTAMTGMRRGEVMGLRWADVDLDRRKLHLTQQLRSVSGAVFEFADLKTSRSRRTVMLDQATTQLLRDHRRTQLEERLAIGEGYRDHDLVFPLPDGSPWNPDSVADIFDRRIARLGLPRITFHGLRHGWATMALEGGVHPKVVQERLGHTSIAITLDIYSHVVEAIDEAAAQTVADFVFRPEVKERDQ